MVLLPKRHRNRSLRLATLVYLRRGDKTLMLHRVTRKRDIHQGKWNGLGGKFLPGETPEECARREVREESGLSVKKLALKGFLTFPGFSGDVDWYVFVFEGTGLRGRLVDSPEGLLSWVPTHKLLTLNLWEGDRHFLKWMRKRAFFSGKLVYKDKRLQSQTVAFYK